MEKIRQKEMFAAACPFYARRWPLRSGFPAHGHDFHELAIILEGSGRQMRNGGEDELQPGDLVVVRPGDWHSYEHSDGLLGIDCGFDPLLLQQELAWTASEPRLSRLLWHQAGESHACRLRLDRPAEAEMHFRALVRLLGEESDARGEKIGHLLCILGLAARCVAGGDGGAVRVSPSAAAAARLMDEDPSLPWTTAGLARRVGCRPDHLSRVFARDFGLPLHRWLTCRRIRVAQRLLLRGDVPVAAIAERVGWQDASLFARRFKAETGMSASQWRSRFVTAAK